MKRFIRRKEDFTCEQCKECVTGNGYTNHCPMCLWSKHVDLNPGDRASLCGGAMEPKSVVVTSEEYRIQHKCAQCGFIRAQNSAKGDNEERLIELSTNPS